MKKFKAGVLGLICGVIALLIFNHCSHVSPTKSKNSARALASEDMNMVKMDVLVEDNNILNLDNLPGLLPPKFRVNYILKHGREIIAPRGHLFELPVEGEGQGATPNSPRAILFDQNSGFAISYNGGGPVCKIKKTVSHNGENLEINTEVDTHNCNTTVAQKNGHTLDMIEYNEATGFELWKWDLNGTSRNRNKNGCVNCHGQHNRPVFSMYPDWPGFYGSDNDEMTNPNMKIRGAQYDVTMLVDKTYQKQELEDYLEFRQKAKDHPRYSPLFGKEGLYSLIGYEQTYDNQSIEPNSLEKKRVWKFPTSDVTKNIDWSQRKPGYVTKYPWDYLYELYPFRPAHTLTSTRDVSRAFKFRPGLRFNILMSRYHTKNLSRIIRKQENYKKFGKFFVYNLMRCSAKPGNKSKLTPWYTAAGEALQNISTPNVPDSKKIVNLTDGTGVIEGYPLVSDGGTGFKKNKVDQKNKTRLLEYERAWLLFGLELRDIDMRYTYSKKEYDYVKYPTSGPMKIGYFGENSIYFNAYNDGSTTTDELIVANLLQDLITWDEDLNKKIAASTSKIKWSFSESILNSKGSFVQINEAGEKIKNGQKINKSFFDGKGTQDISDDKLNFWGLTQKYGRFPARYTLDREFFKRMDSLGMWMNLPYAPEIAGDHHRAPWWIGRTKHFNEIYESVCGSLEESLLSGPN